MTIILPSPQSDFVLDLKTTSLMGSRAKLADVPKLHELITHQVRQFVQLRVSGRLKLRLHSDKKSNHPEGCMESSNAWTCDCG